MKRLLIQPDFFAWRDAARDALREGFQPEEIDLQDATVPTTLTLELSADATSTGSPVIAPHTSRAFLESAKYVAAHRNPQRWNLLYRLLYRLQTERGLLKTEDDSDVALLQRLEGQVRRDLQKMRALVRFRKVLEPTDPQPRPQVINEPVLADTGGRELAEEHHLLLAIPTPFGETRTEIEDCPAPQQDCDHFIAWYQPEHRILPLAAPFLAERFAPIRWCILTPDAAVSWDPVAKQLSFSPGLARNAEPAEAELEALWRTYYASLVNPTPPESVITAPKANSTDSSMVSRTQQATAQPFVPAKPTLASIHAALPTCRGCDLYRHPIQVVGGFGPADSPLMLVGEQPGDQEDQQGLPFVGPAGKLLRGIAEELGIDLAQVYLTNAVKHFKFVQRGKLRLHQSPRMSEITACRPWLAAEIEAAKPAVILCLGASASKSLLGGTFSLMRDRGTFRCTPFSDNVMATLHPSAILRARDDTSRHQMQAMLRDDLSLAYQASRRLVSQSA